MTRLLGRIVVAIATLLALLVVVLMAVATVLRTRMRTWGNEESDSVELVTIMNGLEFAGRANAFAGGSIFTMMGGAEIDLRQAQLAPHGAYMQVRTFMGATEIVVPEDWRVLVEGAAFMGVNETTANRPDLPEDAPRLELDAQTYMGALEVTHAPRL